MSSVIEKLDLSEVRNLFTSGIKTSKDELKVGLEYERLPIQIENNFAAKYNGIDGICEILRVYARNENWDYILDENNIIGLKKLHNTITLEPGLQVEMSLKPQKTIQDIEAKIKELDENFLPLLNEFGIKLLKYGVSPLSTYKVIDLLPKRRYKIMANYLWGILSDIMMRETAGIQTCIDFESEEDAMKKFRVANMLSPFTTAMFANSPIRGGVDTGYKTFRALSWLNTDTERCGFATNFNKDFSFDDYINNVLETPLIMIQRNNRVYPINGTMTLKQFMSKEYQGEIANIEDFKLAANLYFPDVRLRKFIEIRNHDCVGNGLELAIIAFYKGILYSKKSIEDIENLFLKYKYQDFAELRYAIPKQAMQAKICKNEVKDIAKELVNIATLGLKEQNKNEEKYLEPLQELVSQGLCPADIILKNWYGIWKKDISKLINFTAC
ncbi:MAG: glutamate--cysteine ligase [Candidatus Gastranaerophilaceae bacterium]